MSEVLNHVDTGPVSAAPAGPTLVFVHGLACALEDWRAQIDALSGEHRCIAVDLPGHGQSPGNGALTIGRFGEAVAATVRALDTGPLVLIGHSMGCRVVMEVANRLGAGVEGIVLVDGSVRGSGDPEAARNETRAQIEQAGFAPYVEQLFRVMFVPGSDAALVERIVQRALRLDAEAGTGLIADLAAWDAGTMSEVLSQLDAPLLVVQSTGVSADRRRIPLKIGDSTPFVDRIIAARPDAAVRIVPDVGHFTMHDAPEQVSALLAQFAADLTATSRA